MKYIEILANDSLKWVKLDEKSVKKYKDYTHTGKRTLDALKNKSLDLYCLLDNTIPVVFIMTFPRSTRGKVITNIYSPNKKVIEDKYLKAVAKQVNSLLKLGYELEGFGSFFRNNIVLVDNKLKKFSNLNSFETPKFELITIYDNIKKLPDTFIVNGTLDLSNSIISKLPSNLTVKGRLILNNRIKEIPNNASLTDLILTDSSISKLPDNLTLRGYLSIGDCPIKKLPKELKVNTLRIFNANIKELPDDLEVTDSIYILNTLDIKIPKRLEKKVKRIYE